MTLTATERATFNVAHLTLTARSTGRSCWPQRLGSFPIEGLAVNVLTI